MFHIDPFGAGVTVEISGLTIRNGSATFGGGIRNNGTLTLTSSTVSGNTASSGGGIFNGFIATATLISSTVSGNSASNGGGFFISGTATLTNVTISDNTAAGSGGGIFISGTATLTNVTVSGNGADDDGGGIHNNGTLTLTSSTVSGNTAALGVGISNFATATLKNTIVANSTASSDCSGTIISAGYNLDSDGTCGLAAAGDISNADPLLGPLADNGGPTETHGLLAGSPAIDAGSPDCPPPASDQRGVTRPVDGDSDSTATCDMGAYEAFGLSPSFSDVAADHFAFAHIEALFGAGITTGCGGGNYCPNDPVTRAQMAVFIILALNDAPVTPTGGFADVPTSHFAAGFIERLAELNITAGCGGGNYCPNDPVTRAQMAVFIVVALNDAPVTPTGVFDDVPTSHFAAGFIERLAELGITAGCGGGNYCPNDPVTRAQMAVFIVVAFNLPLPP